LNRSNPDVELYRALKPALASMPGSLLVAISSPYRKSGLLHTKFRQHFGKDDDKILFVKGATRVFYPTIEQSVVDEALRDDPESAASEGLGEPRSDIADFVSRESIESCIEGGVVVRAPLDLIGGQGFVI
jgi:hypothetical protein